MDAKTLVNAHTKEQLIDLASQLGLKKCEYKTKGQIASMILSAYHAKGGINNLSIKGIPIKPVPRAEKPKRPISGIAVATGVEMLKDGLSSTLAKNAIASKGLVPRAVSALAAASDAVGKISESVRSDERKRKPRTKKTL